MASDFVSHVCGVPGLWSSLQASYYAALTTAHDSLHIVDGEMASSTVSQIVSGRGNQGSELLDLFPPLSSSTPFPLSPTIFSLDTALAISAMACQGVPGDSWPAIQLVPSSIFKKSSNLTRFAASNAWSRNQCPQTTLFCVLIQRIQHLDTRDECRTAFWRHSSKSLDGQSVRRGVKCAHRECSRHLDKRC